jgi:hypothetical protein
MSLASSRLVFGLDTFGDVTHDADDHPLSHAQTIRNLIEQGVLVEEVGVDFFGGIGEHHTTNFPLSAADVVLSSIAARTNRLRIGSAVTVLSSDDPVGVFQPYSTRDAVSAGRAPVIRGRGSSVDSFPLFGYDLADYEDVFEEKFDLFAEPLKGGPVMWRGTARAPLNDRDVVPQRSSAVQNTAMSSRSRSASIEAPRVGAGEIAPPTSTLLLMSPAPRPPLTSRETTHLEVEPRRADRGQHAGDLLRDGLRRPDVQRPSGPIACMNESLVRTANPRVLLTWPTTST